MASQVGFATVAIASAALLAFEVAPDVVAWASFGLPGWVRMLGFPSRGLCPDFPSREAGEGRPALRRGLRFALGELDRRADDRSRGGESGPQCPSAMGQIGHAGQLRSRVRVSPSGEIVCHSPKDSPKKNRFRPVGLRGLGGPKRVTWIRSWNWPITPRGDQSVVFRLTRTSPPDENGCMGIAGRGGAMGGMPSRGSPDGARAGAAEPGLAGWNGPRVLGGGGVEIGLGGVEGSSGPSIRGPSVGLGSR